MSNPNSKLDNWVPNIWNDGKLKLRAAPIQDGAWDAVLRIKQRENNPCIEISTGVKTQKGAVIKHDIGMGPRELEELIYVLEQVSKSKTAVSFELENWGYSYFFDRETNKSKRSENVEILARFSLEKREDGQVTFTVALKNGKIVIPFEFKGSEYHRWMRNGTYIPEGESSKIAALAWCANVRSAYNFMYASQWEEPAFEKRKRLERMQNATGAAGGGGGFGGGGNNRGYSQGNNQGGGQGGFNKQAPQQPQNSYKPPAPAPMIDSFDDDAPF